MIDVLTAADVRRQDAASERDEASALGVSALGVSALGVSALMENAGFAVARTVRGMFGLSYGLRVAIVCGPGNNGGDGLVAGRVLARWGSHVTAILPLGEPRGAAGGLVARFPGRIVSGADADQALERADVIVDALFGVGLSRAPEGTAAVVIQAMNDAAAPIVSIDVPSGMDADTGTAPGIMVRPAGVISLGGMKAGLCFASDTAQFVETAQIGVVAHERYGAAVALEEQDVRDLLPTRAADSHKRASGVVLVVAGSRAMPGAAALTTGAVVHTGAGLTTLAAHERVCAIALGRTPEITTMPLPENPENPENPAGVLDGKAAEMIVAREADFDAIAIGPGISRHPDAADAMRAIVTRTSIPLVADADAINAFEGSAQMLRDRAGFTIVTPHEGEAARLLGRSAQSIKDNRLRAAAEIAEATGHAVALKGPGTIVTARGLGTFVNLTGNRGLAQGGTGDVLTGMIASLLAQAGRDAPAVEHLTMAAVAVWLHGRTADLVAERVAPHPANASALIDALPEAIAGLFA